MKHTITLYRDDNRMSSDYGQHYIIERVGLSQIKVEDIGTYHRDEAYTIAANVARLYGADLVDRRPAPCLYGGSAD